MVNFGYAESSRTAWAAQDAVSNMKKTTHKEAQKRNVLILVFLPSACYCPSSSELSLRGICSLS